MNLPKSFQGMNRWQWIFYLAVLLDVSGLIALVVWWGMQSAPALSLPTWLILSVPIVGLGVLAAGLIRYDLLVFATFALIGFVRVEPAPFDLMLVVVFILGVLFGRLKMGSSSYGALIYLGILGLILTNLAPLFFMQIGYDQLRFMGISFYMLVLFVFVRMFASDLEKIRLLLIGYTLSAMINALLVMTGFLGINTPFSVLDWSVRGVGFFKDPNVYGPFIVVSALWLVDRSMQPPFHVSRSMPRLLLAVFLGLSAVFSLSRAVWINLLVSGVLIGWFVVRRNLKKGISFALILILFLLLVLLALEGLGLNTFVQGHLQLQDYDHLRFDIQQAGLIAGLTHPVGVGPGEWANTHSLYVKTLAEQGLIGFFSLMLIIGCVLFPLLRRAWFEKGSLPVMSARILAAMIIGQMINSLVIDSIHWRHLWVLLGIAWAYQDYYGVHAYESHHE